jgi:DNA polymerase-3 subunit gamma/tau
LLRGLMESLHAASRAKAGALPDALQSAEERESANAIAQRLGWGTIHRLWQMLLKGLQDVGVAPDPREAAEMALLRLIHAADLPDPASLVARMSGEDSPVSVTAAGRRQSQAAPIAEMPRDFAALVRLVGESGKHLLAQQLHDQVGLVHFDPPALTLRPSRPLGTDWPREVAAVLKALTGTAWQVGLSDDASAPSLLDQEKIAEQKVRADVLADPNVAAVLEAFPGAELETFPNTGG